MIGNKIIDSLNGKNFRLPNTAEICMSENADTFDKGLSLRRDMFGVAGADQAVSNASAFSRPLQDMVTRFCFGEVWQRPCRRPTSARRRSDPSTINYSSVGNDAPTEIGRRHIACRRRLLESCHPGLQFSRTGRGGAS
jgi:hypothetical protein